MKYKTAVVIFFTDVSMGYIGYVFPMKEMKHWLIQIKHVNYPQTEDLWASWAE